MGVTNSRSTSTRSWRRLLAGGAAIAVLLLTLLACNATSATPASSATAVTNASQPGGAIDGTTGNSQARQKTATPTPTRRPRPTATSTAKATKRVTPTATPTRRPRPSPTPTRGSQTINGLPVIHLAELPREALDTLRLIDQGGPFPYSKDGVTFQNREGLLPKKPNGYYAEYTVITPGENDRGARRIIAGDGGEFYYTDDHYDSFQRIVK